MECFLLTISLLAALLLIGVYCHQIETNYNVPVPYSARILSVPVIDSLDFLEGKKQLTAQTNPGVYFGGALLPYTLDGTLYLSQDYSVSQWEGELTSGSKDMFLCTLPDDAWNDKAGSIRNNHRFPLWLVGEDCYYELSLAISGMPVMSLSTERAEEQDNGDYETDPDRYYYDPSIIYYGKIQVFNPGMNVSRYEILESGVRYYLRGTSSAVYEKKGYSIGLLDADGKNLNQSLLGMRSDNHWKLKAMVADTERILEKTACDLWEHFADSNDEVNEAGPRMEYLELIIDNEYKGLYGLIEPVDAKKLELDKNDILYKFTDWTAPEDEDIQYAIDRGWRIMSFQRIRYPDVITDYEKAWYPARDYLNTFYHNRDTTGSAEDKIYLSNAIDMLLFTMTVSGSDNFFKNMYFAADVSENGSYTMRQIPWDLDLTFGRIYGDKEYEEDETMVYEEAAIPFIRDRKPDLIRPYLQERWAQCRNTFLDTEYILNLLRENQNYLIDSGAVERENARWLNYQMSVDISRIETYQKRRMAWLDSYFAEY
ncbi:MAG: hypothetical protein HFH82_03825 [Lachnospiraceae bacterium]|nr:hypothetical protein [Lachnospiraceae bacterium]